MKTSESLAERIRSENDAFIIKALATREDYTSEAQEIYVKEAERRGLNLGSVAEVKEEHAQMRRNKEAKVFAVKGIGTRLYGMRGFAADGSYITTKWFVLILIPIYPIGSFRIKDCGKETEVLEVLPINKRQVIDTYIFCVVSWALIGETVSLLDGLGQEWVYLSWLALLAPVVFLYYVRKRAKSMIATRHFAPTSAAAQRKESDFSAS